MAVRRSRLLLLAVLLLGVAAPLGSAHGSCAGPQLSVGRETGRAPTLRAGLPVEVQGRYFVEGCDDTGSSSVLGCSAPEESEEVPMTEIRLTLVQGDKRWELGVTDAGTGEESADRGHTRWSARVPADARSGPAVLVAGTARLKVEIDGRRSLDR